MLCKFQIIAIQMNTSFCVQASIPSDEYSSMQFFTTPLRDLYRDGLVRTTVALILIKDSVEMTKATFASFTDNILYFQNLALSANLR